MFLVDDIKMFKLMRKYPHIEPELSNLISQCTNVEEHGWTKDEQRKVMICMWSLVNKIRDNVRVQS